MDAPFAALDVMVESAVDQHLSDAYADFGGGVGVNGLLINKWVDQLGVEGMRPVFSVRSTALPVTVTHETLVMIRAVAYRVVGIQPSGWRTNLILERR